MDDLRPKGTVVVMCVHPDCGTAWWVDPLDPRLPNGPPGGWNCGDDHKVSKRIGRALTRMHVFTGVHWRSMRACGPQLDQESAGCSNGRSYSAGIASVHDRYRGRPGRLEWSCPEDIKDPYDAAARVQWDVYVPELSETPVSFEPSRGEISTVNYQWRGHEIRKYTFAKCSRSGCPHYVMVDYDKPSMTCGPWDTYAVGGWGGQDLPLPRWWNNRTFRCGETLSTQAPYPCAVVHGGETLSALEATGVTWTMWDQRGSEGSVLFRTGTAFGLLRYANEDVFSSQAQIVSSTYWASLQQIADMVTYDRHGTIAGAVRAAAFA